MALAVKPLLWLADLNWAMMGKRPRARGDEQYEMLGKDNMLIGVSERTRT